MKKPATTAFCALIKIQGDLNLPNPIDSPTREKSPCFGCKEKFTACHDRCPKDKRGERGYSAWKQHLEMLKDAKKEYERSRFNKYAR